MKYFFPVLHIFIILMLLFTTSVAFAQNNTIGTLEYLDDPLEARIILSDGSETDVYIGLELTGGTIIQTFLTTAEIRLKAGGSMLRLAENCTFRLEAERVAGNENINAFTLSMGTIRCVAARVTDQGYAVHTPSAVMGVRGTDFVVAVLPEGESLSVLEGVVETLHRESGSGSMVQAGYSRDLGDGNARPKALDEDLRDLLVRMNSFRGLDPTLITHASEYTSLFDLAEEAGLVSRDEVEEIKAKSAPGSSEADRDRPRSGGVSAEDGSAAAPSRGMSTDNSRREKKPRIEIGGEEVEFLISIGASPALVQVIESTWFDVLGMGFGGSVSVTAGLADDPGFYGGFIGGVYSLAGKAGHLDNSLWIPLGFTGGIRRNIAPPMALYVNLEGGMQYARLTYDLEDQDPIAGWGPYLSAGFGGRYDLSPWVFEAGVTLGSAFEASFIPYVRVNLGIVYEVRL